MTGHHEAITRCSVRWLSEGPSPGSKGEKLSDVELLRKAFGARLSVAPALMSNRMPSSWRFCASSIRVGSL
jgi:hypothetical protein